MSIVDVAMCWKLNWTIRSSYYKPIQNVVKGIKFASVCIIRLIIRWNCLNQSITKCYWSSTFVRLGFIFLQVVYLFPAMNITVFRISLSLVKPITSSVVWHSHIRLLFSILIFSVDHLIFLYPHFLGTFCLKWSILFFIFQIHSKVSILIIPFLYVTLFVLKFVHNEFSAFLHFDVWIQLLVWSNNQNTLDLPLKKLILCRFLSILKTFELLISFWSTPSEYFQ